MPLRDAFIYTAVIALSFAGMKIGGILASLIVFLVLIIYSLRLIVAIVGKPDERSAAIGFVVPATVYALVLASVGQAEFGITSPHLLTSQLAAMAQKPLGNGLAATTWEIMSLFHAIAIIVLGAIGSFFAQETVRHRHQEIPNVCAGPVAHATGKEMPPSGLEAKCGPLG